MRIRNLLQGTVLVIVVALNPDISLPFGDESVRVFPTCEITPDDRVVLEILIQTSGSPAFLAQPTEVVREADAIFVTLFPDFGPLTAPDLLVASVDLGKLTPGTYPYQVALCFGGCPIDDPPTARGQFVVVEEPCESASASPQRIYWGDFETDTIKRATLDGAKVENLAIPGLGFVSGLVPDFVNRKLYWSDVYWLDKSGGVRRSELDGQNVVPLATAADVYPTLAAIDLGIEKLFWSHEDGIARCTLDGSGVQDVATSLYWPQELVVVGALKALFWTGGRAIHAVPLDGGTILDVVSNLDNPSGLLVDVPSGRLYWGERGKIWRAELDGSNVQPLFDVASSAYLKLALDRVAGKLYWAIGDLRLIQAASLDGTEVDDLVVLEQSTYTPVLVLDSVGGKMYWTLPSDSRLNPAGRIQRANLDGSDVEDVATGLGRPVGVSIDLCGWAAGISRPTHALLSSCLTGSGSFISSSCRCADLSADERVDLVDFSILQRAFAP